MKDNVQQVQPQTMDQRILITWEIVKEDRKYSLVMPYGAKFEEVNMVLNEFLSGSAQLEKIALEAAEKQKAEQDAKELEN